MFGAEGEGVGQFSNPEGIAVDNSLGSGSAGNVYVADRNNDRVDEFAAEGSFRLAWGWGVANGEDKLESCGPEAAPPTSECHAGREGSGSGEFGFDSASGVAVDGAPGLSQGDVYVEDIRNHRIEKFTAGGQFVLAWGEGVADGKQEAERCGPEAGGAACQAGLQAEGPVPGEFLPLSPSSIAVDSSGTVYVGDENRVQSFSEAGVPVGETILEGAGFIEAVAVNEAKDIYVRGSGLTPGVHEYESLGKELGTPRDSSGSPGVIALGPTDELFVDDGAAGRILEFEAAGGEVASVPRGSTRGGEGLASGTALGALYLLDGSAVHVVAHPVPGPLVEAEEGAAEPAGRATLTASVDPEGQTENASEESQFHFEYGETAAYGASTPSEPSVGGNFESRVVSVQLSGLEPASTYHFRVVLTSAEGKTTQGPDETVLTLPALSIDTESASEVSAISARLGAEINPLGSKTEYHFQYGLTTVYEKGSIPVPDASVGSGVSPVSVGAQLEGLVSSTVYHYRVLAHNALGEAVGTDHTFVTQGASTRGVIDGRAWEMVSPPDKHGASLEMSTSEAGLFQAAQDGGAVGYFAEAPITTGPSGSRSFAYSQLLSTRGTDGWATQDITTPEESVQGLVSGGGLTEYKMFSSDLTSALVEPQGATPLCSHPVAECPERSPYLRDAASGAYQPLLTPSNVPSGTNYGGKAIEPRSEEQPGVGGAGFEDGVKFVTATPDMSHIVLSSKLVLTREFEAGFEGGPESLYAWSGGALKLASILPGGQPAGEAGFDSQLGDHNVSVRNAISSDGSRIVFEAASHLYLRDLSLGRSVQLDTVQAGVVNPGHEAPIFIDATTDGSRVFFLDTQHLTADSTGGDLYMCEVSVVEGEPRCDLKDLTVPLGAGEEAGVLGFDLGVDQAGTLTYFVASGVLATAAQRGEPNLYVEDTVTGQTRLVAVLSGGDAPDWGVPPEPLATPNIADLTARVSTDGRYLAFMSERPLTGYDNEDVTSQAPGERMDEEVFLYHAPAPADLAGASGTLACVSCDATGARPHGVLDPPHAGEAELALLVDRPALWRGRWLAGSLPGWPSLDVFHALYEPRNLSDDGRLFFDSADALVPGDGNGREDVYEYEPDGAGVCGLATGCVGLISSGSSSEESAFIDASGVGPGGGEGEDVFFMTAAQLALQDSDKALDVYDAHVCSGVVPCPSRVADVPPGCTTADSCRAAPAPQPVVFGAPATATFSGPGNPTPPSSGPKTAAQVRAERLAGALKACHRKHGKHKQRLCERRARRAFGAARRRGGTMRAARAGDGRGVR